MTWPGTLWRPTSPCDDDCVREAGAEHVGVFVRLARLAGLVGALLVGMALLPVLPLLAPARRPVVGGVWARVVLRALGVRLAVRGRLPRRRALLVANHISWLDTVAMLAVAPSRMLAKREVRAWPVIGVLAAAGGTVFVDRSRPRTLPATVRQVADALRAGCVVAAFPEGTTWCGASTGRFRPALFQAAVDAGVPIVPINLGYWSSGRRTAAPAFVGEDTLWRSVRRVLAVRGLEVRATAGSALHPVPLADRRAMARIAELAVRGGDLREHRAGVPMRAAALDLAA